MNSSSYKGKLTLVGAGPGDPELITLKGIRALGEAQVVLYDALANASLLQYAPPDALRIFVGKRKDRAAYTQQQTNNLIVHYATHVGPVVRLKGGDPFVFGRGYEEMVWATEHGIEVDIVPGVSSALAIPALMQIPLTARGVSESFWVTTATLAGGDLSRDLVLAAHSSATVIILMGLHKLKEIAVLYQLLGKSHLPVAVVQDGSLPEEKSVIGTMDNIVELAEAASIASPALIIAGKTVALQPQELLQELVRAHLF